MYAAIYDDITSTRASFLYMKHFIQETISIDTISLKFNNNEKLESFRNECDDYIISLKWCHGVSPRTCWLFVRQFIQANIKENSKSSTSLAFCEENNPVIVITSSWTILGPIDKDDILPV